MQYATNTHTRRETGSTAIVTPARYGQGRWDFGDGWPGQGVIHLSRPRKENTIICGAVTARPFKAGRYQLDFNLSGVRQRPVVPASPQTISQIIGAVDGALLQIRLGLSDPGTLLSMISRLQGRELVARSPRIDTVLAAGIESSPGGEGCKRNYLNAADTLIQWLGSNHPRVVLWADLSPALVHDFFMSHRDRSPAALKALVHPLRLAVKRLRMDDESAHNPLRGFTLPEALKATKGKTFLDVVELKRFMEQVPETVLGPVACCAMLGLRPSEATALTVADIDLARAIVRVRPNGLKSKTKNAASTRALPMPECLIPYLRKTLVEGSPDAPAFGNAVNLPEWWGNNKAKFEVPQGFTLYGLRGSFASICYGAGADSKAVASFLGHSQTGDRGTAILESHYLHVTSAKLVHVAESFNRAFGNRLATVVAA